jgi:hypothetical protein
MSLTISNTFYTRITAYKLVRGFRLMSLTISNTFYTCITAYNKQRATDRVPLCFYYFQHVYHHAQKARAYRSTYLSTSITFSMSIAVHKKQGLMIDAPYIFYYFQHAHHHVQKARGSIGMCSRFSIWLTKFSKKKLQLSRYRYRWFGSTPKICKRIS